MSDKVELIREISSYHPASEAGLKRKWSHYTGGMTDTGGWYFWEMYDNATIEGLELCLAELKEEWKPRAAPDLSEEDRMLQSQLVRLPDGIIVNKLHLKKLEEMQTRLLTGFFKKSNL